MPCYYPINAIQPFQGAPLTLYGREQEHLYRSAPGKHLQVSCGQCSGCRRRRSLEWATRCVHEAQLHRYNCYITLTYNQENLPKYHSLQHEHFALFMKKLRHRVGNDANILGGILASNQGQRRKSSIENKTLSARFYQGGEYGDLYGRPHYHAILFGIDFADKQYHGRTKAGQKIYRSPTLEQLWKHGYSSVGGVSFATAAYISRYIMKKRTGDKKDKYEILDPDTGEIAEKKKEYNCMSRAPGIGKAWWEKYKADLVHDQVITNSGRKLRPPRFYDKQLKRHDLALYQATKLARELEALAHQQDHTPERLAVQETVANSAARHLKRNLE